MYSYKIEESSRRFSLANGDPSRRFDKALVASDMTEVARLRRSSNEDCPVVHEAVFTLVILSEHVGVRVSQELYPICFGISCTCRP